MAVKDLTVSSWTKSAERISNFANLTTFKMHHFYYGNFHHLVKLQQLTTLVITGRPVNLDLRKHRGPHLPHLKSIRIPTDNLFIFVNCQNIEEIFVDIRYGYGALDTEGTFNLFWTFPRLKRLECCDYVCLFTRFGPHSVRTGLYVYASGFLAAILSHL